MKDVPEDLVVGWHQTGSTVICDPPVLTTDEDYVIYTYDMEELVKELLAIGYKICGDAEYKGKGEFTAVRKGKYNYIIVEKEALYNRYEAAMLLAKKRNLCVKEVRVALFRQIIDGPTADNLDPIGDL